MPALADSEQAEATVQSVTTQAGSSDSRKEPAVAGKKREGFQNARRDWSGRREAPRACGVSRLALVSSRPPIEPCVRFSLTPLTDVFHRRHSAFPATAGWVVVR